MGHIRFFVTGAAVIEKLLLGLFRVEFLLGQLRPGHWWWRPLSFETFKQSMWGLSGSAGHIYIQGGDNGNQRHVNGDSGE